MSKCAIIINNAVMCWNRPCLLYTSTGQLLDFLDQGQRLLMGNKFRGLDAIHEELELRQFKVPTCYIVAVIVPLRYLNDVQAKIPQSVDITIDRLSLRGNIMKLQVGNDLAGGHGMLFVRVFQQVLLSLIHISLPFCLLRAG